MKLRKNLAYRKIEDKIFIVDISNSILHSTNETGARIFELIADGYDFDKIVEKMYLEFDVDKDELIKDVKSFISELKQKDLVE